LKLQRGQEAHWTKIFDALLLKLQSRTSLKIYFFSFSYIEPAIFQSPNIKRAEIIFTDIYCQAKVNLQDLVLVPTILPVEERLFTLTLKPINIINLKIMAIAMAGINLLRRRDKTKNMQQMKLVV
jgi:hypothetical protein